MRAVVQRVLEASVRVEGHQVARIGQGLLVFVGVGREDGSEDVRYLAEKVAHLRIFPDEAGKMNRSLLDLGGAVLAVSQFTLWGDCRKGRRPSFVRAGLPEDALLLYEAFLAQLQQLGLEVQSGVFQAMMEVHLVNDGPVTLLLDSGKDF